LTFHASQAINATKATIHTAQNKLWRAAALLKYSSLSIMFYSFAASCLAYPSIELLLR
jgi:hypothetical protein